MFRGRRKLFTTVLVAFLVAAGYGGYRWWHEHPPYGPEALEFAATVEQLPPCQGTWVEYHGVKFHHGVGWAAVGGRITWQTPAGSSADWDEDGRFVVFVVDKRVDLRPPQIWGVSPSGHWVVSSVNGEQNLIAAEVPWLRGVADVKTGPDAWRVGGGTLVTTPAAGEVDFVVMFPELPAGDPERRFLAAAPITLSDIMIAVAFVGPDRQVYWAERVYG